MKQLVIIGARGFGREVYNLAIESRGYNDDFVVKGFLDDKYDALDCYNEYPPIFQASSDNVLACKVKHFNRIIEKIYPKK